MLSNSFLVVVYLIWSSDPTAFFVCLNTIYSLAGEMRLKTFAKKNIKIKKKKTFAVFLTGVRHIWWDQVKVNRPKSAKNKCVHLHNQAAAFLRGI